MSRPTISYPTPVGQPVPGPSNYQHATSPPPAAQMDMAHLPRRSSLQVRQAGQRQGPNTLDSSITRLLVVTKQLLQGLEQWAQGYLTEDNVSDIYVRLGDGFETCVTAFHRVGISTRDLDGIPQDLRACLEQCLAEDPCQESLNLYLPDIRQIIYNLLDGLKRKQAQYKRNMVNAQQAQQVEQLAPAVPPGQGKSGGLPAVESGTARQPKPGPTLLPDDRLSVRSATSNASLASGGSRGEVGSGNAAVQGGSSPNTRNGDLPPPAKVPSSTALAERERERAQRQPSGPSRPVPPDAFRPPRRIASETSQPSSRNSPSPQPPTISLPDSASSRGVQLKDEGPVPSPPASNSNLSSIATSTQKPTPPRPERFSRDRDSFANTGGRVSRFSADSDITNGSPVKSPPARSPPTHIQTLPETVEPALPTGASTSFSAFTDAPALGLVPALPKLELPSTSISFTTDLAPDINEEDTATMPDIPPESHRTLAALRGFDPLERRASKRYSSFAFNKMLPSSPNKRPNGAGGFSPGRPAVRRADSEREKVPPMPSLPEGLHKGEPVGSARMTRSPKKEEDEPPLSARSDGSSSSMRIMKTPESRPSQADGLEPPILVLSDNTPRPSGERPQLQAPPTILPPPTHTAAKQSSTQETEAESPSPTSLQVYLQLGRQVKKCRLDLPVTFEGLRLLFMEKFEYDSGLDDFPDVYVRDPVSGVGYELEDMDDVRQGSVLSLNIEPLDQVKKCRLDLPVTFEGLRLLFMEKFEYDSGLDDFPDVYVRDPVSGVGYELEDMDDVRQGSVLSLNIEPLDQVKQHFDHTFAGLMAEVKEMKKALDHSRRMSMSASTSLLAVSQSSASVRNAPPPLPFTSPASKPPSRLPSPRLDSASTFGGAPLDPSRRAELEKHHSEIQSLRRDLAIVRQIHADFLAETKESFSALRTQNNSMKEVIKTKIGGSRALLDNSKAKLESQCSETIQAVEEIQDIIDSAREDAYRRFVVPSSSHMKKIKADLTKAIDLAERFAGDVGASEATWRATWAQELSRVKEEQNLLAHQRKLGEDLKNDLKDAGQMWENVEEFVSQRKEQQGGVNGGVSTPGGTGVILRSYRPPTPDGDPSGGIPNLLMEIRTKEADPHSRLRAIEAQARQREKEKQVKLEEKDEFAGELEGFVKGRKLRKTGGTEEVERARNRRQELTLKKMLTGDQPPLAHQHTGSGSSRVGSVGSTPTPGGVASPMGMVGSPIGGGGNGAKMITPQTTGSGRVTPQVTGGSLRSLATGSAGTGGSQRGSMEVKKEPNA